MKRILLLLLLVSSNLITFAIHNDFYAIGDSFDDQAVGKTYPVVTVDGAAVEGASAVVEVDPNNPDNKVLHITTGAVPGYVELANPDDLSASTMKKYPVLTLSIKSNVAYDQAANCHFELYYGKVSGYKDSNSNPSVFTAGVWKDCVYKPIELAKSSLSKTMRIGLYVANADYYIDNIVFLASEDAYEREAEAKEKARQDSIFKAGLAERDLQLQAFEEAYAAASSDLDYQMDKLIAYDFEKFEVGTEFPVYELGGKSPIEGATAVVEMDGRKNKVLHVTSVEGKIGYVELDNPVKEGTESILSAASVLKLTNQMSINIKRVDDASADAAFDVTWGGIYAHKTAPSNALTKGSWVNNVLSLALSKNSLAKQMRIGLHSEAAEFYIDEIVFLLSEYSLNRPESTVKYWANKIGKNFGTCVNPGISTNDDFGKTVVGNFNMVVLENAMKFDATEPSRNGFNWQADGVVNFAHQNGMKVRGHTLTWHGQNPDWVANTLNGLSGAAKRQEAIKILKNHIYNVVGHWKGKIAEWDVVNECLEENVGRAVGDGYSTRTYSVWYSGFGGEDYIDSAFVWAHQADPDAKLYINDYNIGHWGNGHYENGKTHAMYNLAKRLKDSGIPIDGVGMQMHTSVSGLQPEQIEETVKQFRAIGLNCIITEMDMPGGEVRDKKCVREISAEELRIQAEKYAQIAEIMIKYDNVPTFMVWGVRDNQSWLDGSEGTKPLFFFADLTPHQAYIDVRKTYQKRATVMTGVEDIVADTEDDDPVWYSPQPKTHDVYDIVGRKVMSDGTIDNLEDLPDGLYIIGGKKVMIKH